MKVSVYVNNIEATGIGVVVEASNGSTEGPPFIRFSLSDQDGKMCHIGKRYDITIEEV